MKKEIVKNSVYDTFIRMLFLSFIIVACLAIMYPFINVILWTLILTLAIYPIHNKLTLKLKGKTKLASVIIIFSILVIVISLFLAGVLLTIKNARENILKFFKKVGGNKGDELAKITIKTVGSVVKGVLGESFVMVLLNGCVFLLAGVPYIGIWIIMAFILAVLQLPILIVTVPIMIYFFVVKSLVSAIIWTIALILVSLSDNILTPIMLGKGAPVPMVVIFVGVIGGFIFSGFIGLFTGAILMSIGYSLFIEWLHTDDSDSISGNIEVND